MESIVRLKKWKDANGDWKVYETPDGKLVISVFGCKQPKYKTIGTTKRITIKGINIFLWDDGTVHVVV